jgi:MFS family permease
VQHSHLRHVLVGPVAISRAQIVWPKSIVTATIAAAITFACIQLDQVGAALPLVIGAAFVGLANAGTGPSQEIKGMAWCLLWATLATLIGGLAATLDMALVLIAVVMALVAGFAGALGKRGGLIGVLSLVLYVVFSGAPDTERTAISSAVLVAIGGIVQLLIGGAFALLSNRRHPITQQAITQQVMTEHVSEERRSVMDRLREHTRRDSQFARHAVRLAVAVGVATVIAQGTGWPHEYWIPMTVVWMSRPDKNGTSTRVVERTLGTFLGIGISLLFIDLIGTGPIRMPLYIFFGTLFAIAFINANYPIAVGGITLIVITLFTIDGEPLSETVPYRLVCTLVAAVITIAASFLWPYRPQTTTKPSI